MYTLKLMPESLLTSAYAFYGIWDKKMKTLYITMIFYMWVNYGFTASAKHWYLAPC